MGRGTTTQTGDQGNRVMGRPFWLFASIATAMVVMSMMGQSLTEVGNLEGERPYTGQQLLELSGPPTSTVGSVPPATTNGTAPVNGIAPANDTAEVNRTAEVNGAAEPVPAAPSVTQADTIPSNPPRSPDTTSPVVGSDGTTPATEGTTIDQGETTTTTTAAPLESVDTTAVPVTSVVTEEPQPAEPLPVHARGQAALATVSYPWQDLLPTWTIVFLPEEQGLYGLTKVPDRRIEIYVRDGQSTELLAHVIAHEIGHAVDVTFNTGPDRRLWEESRGFTAPWWPGSGATDFRTGAGDFAESFAAWQVGGESFRSELGPQPSSAQIELLAQLAAG